MKKFVIVRSVWFAVVSKNHRENNTKKVFQDLKTVLVRGKFIYLLVLKLAFADIHWISRKF